MNSAAPESRFRDQASIQELGIHLMDAEDQPETLNSPPLSLQTVTVWIGEKGNVVT